MPLLLKHDHHQKMMAVKAKSFTFKGSHTTAIPKMVKAKRECNQWELEKIGVLATSDLLCLQQGMERGPQVRNVTALSGCIEFGTNII